MFFSVNRFGFLASAEEKKANRMAVSKRSLLIVIGLGFNFVAKLITKAELHFSYL